ncbi:MAG: hypothetical protein KBA96_02920 [Rhodocyclaceae bacterium]|nr:hypothetical protein [Rhodocyclaceae bacterium]
MTRSQIQNLAALIFTGIIAVNANAAPVSADQLSAQKAVAKVIKNPEEAKFGEFTIAGPHGACMTVFKKNWQSLGTHEAFLLRKDGGWDALYVADVPGGHAGCVAEMAKR